MFGRQWMMSGLLTFLSYQHGHIIREAARYYYQKQVPPQHILCMWPFVHQISRVVPKSAYMRERMLKYPTSFVEIYMLLIYICDLHLVIDVDFWMGGECISMHVIIMYIREVRLYLTLGMSSREKCRHLLNKNSGLFNLDPLEVAPNLERDQLHKSSMFSVSFVDNLHEEQWWSQ